MALDYKIIAQALSSATANTDLDIYTVPASTKLIISSINIANMVAGIITVGLAVRPPSVGLSDAHRLMINKSIPLSDFLSCCQGITLQAGSIITIKSNGISSAAVSIFGCLIT